MERTYEALPADALNRPVLFVVDMVNGFCVKGALADPGIAEIAGPIRKAAGILPAVFVCDSHPERAREFESYPVHCLENTPESEIIPSLKDLAGPVLKKNSTNTFFSPDFQAWLDQNLASFDDFVITGCCTDLCILQFALALQAWFNQNGKTGKRVIVPADSVATYDIPGVHDAAFWDGAALANMATNGITVVKTIEVQQ